MHSQTFTSRTGSTKRLYLSISLMLAGLLEIACAPVNKV